MRSNCALVCFVEATTNSLREPILQNELTSLKSNEHKKPYLFCATVLL